MIMLSQQDQQKAKRAFEEVGAVITNSHFVYTSGNHGADYVNKDKLYVYPVTIDRLCRIFAKVFSGENVEVVAGPTVGGVSLSHMTSINFNRLFGRQVPAVFADEEEELEVIEASESDQNFDDEVFMERLGATIVQEDGVEIVTLNNAVEIRISINEDSGVKSFRIVRRVGKKRILKRGYDKVVSGKRVLLVEDIINTGITVVRLREAVEAAGGEVLGVACLCNRSGGKVTAETLGVPVLLSLLDLDMKMYPEADCPICKEKGHESIRQDLGKGRDFLKKIGRSDLLK